MSIFKRSRTKLNHSITYMDQLADIMTNYGQRHVESVKIIRKPDFASYYGFVHFVSHTDALEAFEELDKQPPLYLSIEFARKQRDEKSKVYSGSGNSVSSKERGKDERVTFDGPMPHLKVRLDSEGRKVTLKRQSGHQFIDRDLDLLPEAPNQLFFCFVCGREGIYACKFCRKPYCSKNCQGIDFVSHQAFCKKAKILAETLLCCYKYFPVECFDSGDSEHEKVDPVNDLLFPSGTPPSIWSKLKIGAKMQLVQVFANEDSVWCYLVNGQSDLDACSILDNRLLDYSGEDITLTAKEGDFAAGFSKKYKNYYRCRVLKIMKKIFLVHFIDYGNKEEITQLRALSEELLQKCCYLVKCEKPTNLSLTEFSNFLGNDIKVTIDKVDQNVAQISFHHTNELSITCYPCYSNISTKQTFVIEDSGVSEGKVSLPSSNIKPIPTFHCDDYKVSSEKIASKCLSSANYSVRAVFIRSASELYVQLREDEFQISKMHNDLNSFCNSKRNSYVPNIGEIVSCKFTDNAWYRGKVLEKLNNNDYKVFFVDYGNEDIVSQSDIKVLSDRFLFPQFSICVSLIGVKNKDISKGILDKLLKEDWDMKVIDSNKTPKEVMLFQKNVPITGMITKKNRSNLKFQKLPDKATVKICFEDGKYLYVNQVKDIQSLEEMSVKLNSYSELPAPTCPVVNNVYSGLFDDGLFYRVCIKKQISSDSFEAYFLDYGNYGTVKTSDLREIPEDLFDLPVYCTPVLVEDRKELTLRSDAEYTVEVIRMEGKVQLVKFSQVNEPIVQSPFIPPSLSSFTNSCLPLNESCKVVFKKNVNDLHIAVKLDDYEEMERMNSLLQESKTDIINHLPSVNEVLLAKMDDLWYRCSVVSMLSEENICEVHFIDIGITEHVPTFEMRYLPDACKAFPLFAIKILVESDQPVILDKCYNIYVLNKMSDDIYNVKVYHQYKYSSIHRKELVPMKVSDVIFYHKEGEILFLQNISDIEILAEIQKILVNCSSNSCISYKPDVGELVCAMSQQDNSWYRGCIEEVLTFDEYKVLFIDYGNFENVQRNNMQPLPFALTKFPSLVIPVKIQHNEVIEFEKVYKVVADSNASSGIQSVTIVENNEVLNNTEQKSTSSTPTNCDADKKFDFMGCKAVPFNLGDQDIVIYSVDDEGFIYCAPFNIDNIEANMYLPDIITEHCNNQGIQFEGSQPQLGEMVLALYSVDKRWYRAVVIENSHPQYHVNFIDYGNSETLNIKCLRKMEEKFMELDLQSHMCSISGFTFPPENKMKVISELKKCDFFSSPEPVRANVKIIDQDYIVNIPSMTSHLVNKNLATADDNSLSFLCNSSEK